MIHRSAPRKLLTSSARAGTLIVLGVAETACNLQIGDYYPQDTDDTDYPYDTTPTDTDDTGLADTDSDTDAIGDTDPGPTDTDCQDTDPSDTDGGCGGDTDAPAARRAARDVAARPQAVRGTLP